MKNVYTTHNQNNSRKDKSKSMSVASMRSVPILRLLTKTWLLPF